jgi:hypothetical protein
MKEGGEDRNYTRSVVITFKQARWKKNINIFAFRNIV